MVVVILNFTNNCIYPGNLIFHKMKLHFNFLFLTDQLPCTRRIYPVVEDI